MRASSPTEVMGSATGIAPFEGGWHGVSRDWGLPAGSSHLPKSIRYILWGGRPTAQSHPALFPNSPKESTSHSGAKVCACTEAALAAQNSPACTRRVSGQPGTAVPTGFMGTAEDDRQCRGRTHRYAPTESVGGADRAVGAAGGGTPPLRILREMRKKPVSPRAVGNRPYGVFRRCGLGLPVYHWMGVSPCCCRKVLILEKGRLPKKPR